MGPWSGGGTKGGEVGDKSTGWEYKRRTEIGKEVGIWKEDWKSERKEQAGLGSKEGFRTYRVTSGFGNGTVTGSEWTRKRSLNDSILLRFPRHCPLPDLSCLSSSPSPCPIRLFYLYHPDLVPPLNPRVSARVNLFLQRRTEDGRRGRGTGSDGPLLTTLLLPRS